MEEKKYLILHYDISEGITAEDVWHCYNTLVETFPDKIVVCLPRAATIVKGDRTDLENLLDVYKKSVEILERLLNE